MRVAVDHRKKILKSAAHLFARKPFHEVLMDHVAQKSRVVKGTLYRFYPTKDELFAAVAREHMQLLIDETAAAGTRGTNPVTRLHAMLLRFTELCQEHKNFFHVMQLHEFELRARHLDEFKNLRNILRDNFTGMISLAQKSGDLHCPFPIEIAADMLLGMVRSLLRYTMPDAAPERVCGLAIQVFVQGLKRG